MRSTKIHLTASIFVQRLVLGLIGVVCCSIFAVILFFPFTASGFLMPETEKTEVKTLPADIKSVLGTTTPTLTYKVPILMYHYVEYVQDRKDTIRQSLDIIPYTFDEQLKTLVNAGYTFITAGQLGSILMGTEQLPKKPIVLTFDDGYRDFYTDAYPLLKKYHVPATAYVVPGFLDKPNYMFTYQVQDLVKNGLIEIGAHTIHHVWLKGMNYKEAKTEIADSKKMLDDLFKIHVVSFAYPYGAFDMQAMNIVRINGFWTAVSTVPGIDVSENNRFFLYRLRPGGRTGQTLLNWLSQETSSQN